MAGRGRASCSREFCEVDSLSDLGVGLLDAGAVGRAARGDQRRRCIGVGPAIEVDIEGSGDWLRNFVVTAARGASVLPPNVYKLSCGARPAKRAVRAAHLVSSPREGARPGLWMGEAHPQPPSASTVC